MITYPIMITQTYPINMYDIPTASFTIGNVSVINTLPAQWNIHDADTAFYGTISGIYTGISGPNDKKLAIFIY